MRTFLKVIVFGAGLAALAAVAAYGWRLSGSVSVVERQQPPSDVPRPAAAISPDDWPCWRGAHGNGVSDDPNPPLKWSSSDNVRWRRDIPGRGHGSPVLWGERIFVATADDVAGTQSVLCFNRETGKPLWTREVHRGGLMAKHEKNSHASATPVCDGRRVYINFAHAGGIWVTALDMTDGSIAWQKEAGPFSTDWGYGSSPVLYNDVIIVSGESRRSKLGRIQALAFLAGMDRETGAIVWRVRRPEEHSFGTPVVGRLAGRDQLLLASSQVVTSFDPASGTEIWHCNWDAVRTANTVAFANNLAFVTTTQPERTTLAIRADGTGDVTESHVAWRSGKFSTDVPSPLAHGDRLYMPTDAGVVTCINAATGKVIWQERMGTAISSSPVLAAGRLYVTTEDGKTTVIKADGPYEVLAKNSLGEDVLATPVFVGGCAFIRSVQSLWCIGPPK